MWLKNTVLLTFISAHNYHEEQTFILIFVV